MIDGQSLLPIITNAAYVPPERYVLLENFAFNLPENVAGRAVRNGRFKLILFDNGVQEFYDLSADPYEHTNLLSVVLDAIQRTNYVALTERLFEWETLPEPVVKDFNLLANRFAVTASRASDSRCWLWLIHARLSGLDRLDEREYGESLQHLRAHCGHESAALRRVLSNDTARGPSLHQHRVRWVDPD